MSNVRFNLRDPKADKETPINLVYRYDENQSSSPFRYSTGKKIDPKYWNNDDMRAKKTKYCKNYRAINSKLDKLVRLMGDIETEANRANITLTNKYFSEEMDKLLGKVKKSDKTSFNSFINTFITEKEADPTRAKESIKVYKTFKKHFNAFCGTKKYQYNELSTEVMASFLDYMRHKKKDEVNHYSDNQINKVLSTGKTIIREAHDRGLLTKVDLQSSRLRHSKKPADNIYLTVEEINSIYKLDYSENKTYDETRDLFVVGCYTGLRYSDYSQIKKENVIDLTNDKGEKVGLGLKVFTDKQREKVVIPLKPMLLEILEKYEYQLPQGISNQKTNEALKEIAKDAEITAPTEKVIYRNSRPIASVHPKNELVSSHTARRSFATNAFKGKVAAINIMQITGHKKYETFLKYIKITEEENAVMMVEHEFFK